VVKGKGGVNGSAGGGFAVPGTEIADAIDFTLGNGVREQRAKMSGLAEANVAQHKVVNVEFVGLFVRVAREHDEDGFVRMDFAEDDGIFFGEIRVCPLHHRRAARITRRDVDFQSRDLHAADFWRCVEQRADGNVEAEFVKADEGRNVGAAVVAEGEVFDGDVDVGTDGNVEIGKFDRALEALGQEGLQAVADHRSESWGVDVANNRNRDDEDYQDGGCCDEELAHSFF